MNPAAYRRLLEADLERWQRDGIVSPETAAAIRASMPPVSGGISVATVVAILGGLLIAAAFLAFVAANWSAIARPARFAILLAGIAAAYGVGAWFGRQGRSVLADLSVAVGSIIFGAAIALVGQMYHLGDDFAGGLMLWAAGALIAAALTGSRGALAVALAAGLVWSGTRAFDGEIPHVPFVLFWLISAGLAVAWQARAAYHLVSVAAVVWWVLTGVGVLRNVSWEQPGLVTMLGGSFLLGAGLLIANRGPSAVRAFGLVLSTYGALAFAIAAAVALMGQFQLPGRLVNWLIWSGVAGMLAAALATVGRKFGAGLAAISIAVAWALAMGWARPASGQEPYLSYALALVSMLSLVVSGMLDDVRPRVVAGWIGLGLVLAAITWTVGGSLIARSIFLAAAGAAAVVVAILLGRIMPKRSTA